jgi:hypothetical protein
VASELDYFCIFNQPGVFQHHLAKLLLSLCAKEGGSILGIKAMFVKYDRLIFTRQDKTYCRVGVKTWTKEAKFYKICIS